jgi:hypothetical protein
MKWTFLALVAALMLTGCGGDGNDEPADQTGHLQAGHVQGVDFSTPTRSGSTDANGGFVYLPGEAVTFSIGGIELGTVAGSSDVSLFTVAGLTPPTSERALRRELDRMMRTNTAFTRASNMALLLIELDADGNPDNGLDVRNRHVTLAGVSLDFDLPVRQFEISLYRSVPDVTRNIPPWKPVTWLYGSLGLRVAVHAQTRLDYESLWSSAPTTDTFTYYANGALETNGFDGSTNGVGKWQFHYEYDAMGRGTGYSSEEDFDDDDVVDRSYVTSKQFDGHGDLAAALERAESPFPGESATRRLVEITRDRFGRTTREVDTMDRGNDGSIDERFTFDVIYDTRGNASKVTFTSDLEDDGDVDSTAVTTTEYDARDRILRRVDATDGNSDGTVDTINTDTYRYDSSARGPTRLTSERDFDADGIADWRDVYTWTYDRQGNAAAQSYANEPLADGVNDYASAMTRSFDRDRRVTEETRDDDRDGNGIIDSRQVDTLRYDDAGNTLQHLNDFDSDFDGTVDFRSIEGSEYGADGELLVTANGIDFDGDGLSDVHSATTPTHVVFDDGVLSLTQWYFRSRASYVE